MGYDAKVTKPTLYYYFKSKAGLYQALVDRAHEQRFHLMQKAAAGAEDFADKLTEILAALFEFLPRNRDCCDSPSPPHLPLRERFLRKSIS